MEHLRKENERLRKENERLKEALRFMPPESFLTAYSLLVEAVYLTRMPSPEVQVMHKIRRKGMEIPVRNYRAYRYLRKIDQRLYEEAARIYRFLEGE
jgi:hypothetical protein